jgi:hypothetical protein
MDHIDSPYRINYYASYIAVKIALGTGMRLGEVFGLCWDCVDLDHITFHDLRHTHATILLSQKINPKIVQERLGHSSIILTLDTYSHLVPDIQKEAVNALDMLGI